MRDLDKVRALGFHCFAGGVCVSHACVRLIDFRSPVNVGGTTLQPGDLVHADKHGVLVLPIETARGIPRAAAKVVEREQRIIALCRSPDFSPEELKRLFEAD